MRSNHLRSSTSGVDVELNPITIMLVLVMFILIWFSSLKSNPSIMFVFIKTTNRPIILSTKPDSTMSLILTWLLAKTMAFVGVATGNKNAKLTQIEIGKSRNEGFIPFSSALIYR